jgi:hypothetical protein
MIGMPTTWVYMQRFGPSSRLVTIGRVNALMVFKSFCGSASDMATTCRNGMSTFYAFQDHPVNIP